MTSDVAVVVAGAAAVLSVILLGVVVRQSRAVRSLDVRLSEALVAQQTATERADERSARQQDSIAALETVHAGTPAPAPGQLGGDGAGQPDEAAGADEPGNAAGADEADQITVITDISDRVGGGHGHEDDLTTARIASVTLGGPLIKVAAFSHGVRHALDEEQRMRISHAVRKELRRQRKIRRRRRAEQAPSKGWR